MHNGGIVDNRAEAAYLNFAVAAKKEDLGMRAN